MSMTKRLWFKTDRLHGVLNTKVDIIGGSILYIYIYITDFWFYWMFYDHFSARSLLAKLGRYIYITLACFFN